MTVPVITEPGVYTMPEDVYHADPVPGGSLSSTGARRILPPGCPAAFRYEQLHGRPEKREFDFGHAAHKAVLGDGAQLVTVDADNWRTKAAQEARDTAYADGKVPLLAREVAVVDDMAAALRAHPTASALFDPARGGKPEQSLFWRDALHQVWRRARLDWLPDLTATGRLILADYKSCASADPKAIARSVASFGYHQQAAWYIDAVSALDLATDIAMVFVFQEKTAPYLITVAELSAVDIQLGRDRNDLALRIFRRCLTEDRWPGYADDVQLIELPPYARINDQELLSA